MCPHSQDDHDDSCGAAPPSTRRGGLPPDPDDSDLTSWGARQDAIPLAFKGDRLKPWEIRTVERLCATGQEIEWIAQDRSTSTNDFTWISNGSIEIEMKTTKPTWNAIRGRILNASSRAWLNHRKVKANFLIDIEGATLMPSVRAQLENYNVGRRRYHLNELWVMSQGELEQINLRQ